MKIWILPLLVIALCGSAHAENAIQKFHPQQTLGDGKDGRVFSNFSTSIREAPVVEIIANVIKVSGGDDVYVNARFGNDGKTLEGGKRNPVTQTKRHQIKWTLSGDAPNGKPLVIKAYNGEVKLLFVQVKSRK